MNVIRVGDGVIIRNFKIKISVFDMFNLFLILFKKRQILI